MKLKSLQKAMSLSLSNFFMLKFIKQLTSHEVRMSHEHDYTNLEITPVKKMQESC